MAIIFFFKPKTAYEMRISDWSSDVCSSDLLAQVIQPMPEETEAMTDSMTLPNSLRSQPDASGHFGAFGGRYVAETLMPLILELEKVYKEAKQDPAFDAAFTELLRRSVGRPNRLYHAAPMPEERRPEAHPRSEPELPHKQRVERQVET